MYKVEQTIMDSNLPEELKSKALAEIRTMDKDCCNFTDNPTADAAFVWSKTPSGKKFWSKIHRQLFYPPTPQAKARTTDPVSSHAAADRKNKSGTLSKDRYDVLLAVYLFPGLTAKQLDNVDAGDRSLDGKAHRRSLDLKNMGLIRRERKGKKQMRLFITEAGREALRRNDA